MDMIYSLMTTLLPFDWLSSNFMKNAFLAVLLITPLFGLISTMVVSNRMAFFSDSLGHGAFTGIAIGVLCGAVQPIGWAVGLAVAFALLFSFVRSRSRQSADTIIVVPAATKLDRSGTASAQYAGSLFEQTVVLIGDALFHSLWLGSGATADELWPRHANLE